MSQAKYSADNAGHFGLGFEFYTHFTSPIRRYPDLIVHRLLKSQIMKNSAYRLIPEEDLQTSATMLSACEQRSVKAERQFQAIKKARFMQKFVGEEFEGIISSVTKFGVFVLLRQFEVDGLIRAENLSKEKLEFDEDSLTLVGKRAGQTFAIGDVLTVQVASADPEAGQVDFQLAGQPLQKKEDRFERPSRRREKDRFEKSARRGETASRSEQEDRGGRTGGRRDRFEREEQPARSAKAGRQRSEEKPSRFEKAGRVDREGQATRFGKPNRINEDESPSRPAKFGRFESEEGSRKSARPQPESPRGEKSKKAQAMDKMEERVFEFLSEANSESQNKGEKFDPEKHLQQALKKWRARMGVSDSAPERTSGYRIGGRSGGSSSSKDSSGGRSSNRSQGRGGSGGSERSGGKKSSSSRGRRK